AFKPVLLLVTLRLGIDSLHPTYYAGLKACFKLPSCVGIAGGRPNSSLYFIGLQGDDLIYLDPHFSRAALETKSLNSYTREDFNTYHCTIPRRVNISNIDPSMMVGFYCKTQQEF
ncbi:MAG: peptidase C54, partial [Benjaminiella poitrasii]